MVALFCATIAQSFASSANDGEGTMTVLPVMVPAGTTNNYAFTFHAPDSGNFDAGSRVTLTVPVGWTVPQTNTPSDRGFIHISPILSQTVVVIRSISGTGPWTIAVDITTRQTGGGFTLTYFTVVAPTNGGLYSFNTQTKQAGGTLSPLLTGSPTITVNDPKKFNTGITIATLSNPATNGQPVTFTAIATSLGLGTISGTVTFRDGDTVLGTDTVHAAGLASLTVTNFPGSEDDSHWITAVYSGDDAFNGSVSGSLALEVIAPPQPVLAPEVSSLSLNPDSSVTLQCSGTAGQTYFVQASTDLSFGSWTTISTNVIGTNGTCVVIDPDAAQYQSRFYRTLISY
jgi:hypothetical protein